MKTETVDMEGELYFHKQVIFKLKTDLEFARWENAVKDIAFLKEMRGRAENAFNGNDKDMLFTLIDDWIHELSNPPEKAK